MKILLKNIFSDRKLIVTLSLILILHLFLRLYHAEANLGFGHDEDLGGWIAKDIIADHNFRLIGQETSIDGLFIGPLFYYLQAGYFALFNMDPIGGLYLTLTISVITFFSIYYVFRRFFGLNTALTGVFLYAGSQALAGHDTWIVPTQPTLLWTTWFLFALFYIIKEGNPKIFLLLGVLLGLIWYIHIAFVPLILLIFLAFFVSKKRPVLKKIIFNRQTFFGIIIFLFLMLPFFAFEIRHNFTQTQSLIKSLSEDRHQENGRIFKVYDGVSWSFMNIIYEIRNTNPDWIRIYQAVMLFIFTGMLMANAKYLGRYGVVIYGWLGLVIISQLISKRAISEYYFTNLSVLEILTIAVFLTGLTKKNYLKIFVLILLAIFAILNLDSVIKRLPNGEGYLMRKKLVAFIAKDAKKNNYPCISINYMTSPGKNAGFRYFFWLNGLNVISTGNDVAVYSILNPAVMSEKEIADREGVLGVILPDKPRVDEAACKKPERRLLPPWRFNN
ncbi:MAG TPA: glycosyltransferase family 39 protein [Patescibacteria group bacterium]|nr:glycosyltransferase family 39 protein [Patescibacteria group bacterium]